MWRPRRCLLALLLVLLGATAWARDPDPYNLLDISRGAGDPEIKRAYRKLSLRFHPDKQQGKSAEEAEKNGDGLKKTASVSFLRFARALLEGDPAARLGDADVRAAEFFAPVEWEALERGGGLACYGAAGTRAPTDGWILFLSREERSSRVE